MGRIEEARESKSLVGPRSWLRGREQGVGAKPLLLCAGNDVALIRTRRLILQRYFEVVPAAGKETALRLLSEHPFKILLLCYTLEQGEAESLLVAARSAPGRPKVLALTHGYEQFNLAPPDQEFCAVRPADLVRKAIEMAGIEIAGDEARSSAFLQ